MTRSCPHDPKVWTNYASFYFNELRAPDLGRSLLPRALKSLDEASHVQITSSFAQLEFKSPNGDKERGRTLFETLFTTYPRRLDLWAVLIDLEIKLGAMDHVRHLFERITSVTLKLKKVEFFFKKWVQFEEKHGDRRSIETVRAKAAAAVSRGSPVT